MCQFKCLPTIEQRTFWQLELIEIARTQLSLYKRKINYLRHKIYLKPQFNIDQAIKIEKYNKAPINTGDTVKILSKERIINLLDYRGIYKGCPFIEEMYDHCNKEYKVLKEASYFYDEIKQKLCKCKDIVVLEGTICSGKQKLYKETCDLRCYFFWHKDWLDKVWG
jgi:hypothetical protein